MDTVKPSSVAPKKGTLARTIAKVLHLRAATGVAPVDGIQKIISEEHVKHEKHSSRSTSSLSWSFEASEYEEQQQVLASEAFIAQLFASVSSVKAAYAQLQHAQSPYDAEGIQVADQLIVSELKNLSMSKQCYMKKQFDPCPEKSIALAELQEQKSVLRTYEIMGKKLESQLRLKDSEIMYLKEKLEESNRQNRVLEKRSNHSGQLLGLDDLQQSVLSPSLFITVQRLTVKSIRAFVKLMIDKMKSAEWDLDLAAASIVPDVFYWKEDDKCFTFESFISRVMFDGFHLPNFSPSSESPTEKNQTQVFFTRFMELKSVNINEYLSKKPKSTFAKFCRAKYMRLVHSKMEASLFRNLSQRSLVNSGNFPDTTFFAAFAEMAKRVWLLQCLGFSFKPEVSIFQVQRGSTFSQVYMECVAEDGMLQSRNPPQADPPVAFTVVPGFRIGKTVIQCQVYLSHHLQHNPNP